MFHTIARVTREMNTEVNKQETYIASNALEHVPPVPPQTNRYRLTLRPLPDPTDPAGHRRLRRALKCLLRSFRLRCERCEPDPNDEPDQTKQ